MSGSGRKYYSTVGVDIIDTMDGISSSNSHGDGSIGIDIDIVHDNPLHRSEDDDDHAPNKILDNSILSSSSSQLSERSTLLSYKLFRNFIIFCFLFSITHATVDGVLAFATAELGSKIGADSGFALYFCYTLTALLFAKPCLRYLGPKHGVFVGLCCLFIYVTSFLFSIRSPSIAFGLFVVGSSIGGIGAGILWTSQGQYYSLNASAYSSASSEDLSKVSINFAAIFASIYLLLETVFQLMATAIFLYRSDENKDSSVDEWKTIVFSLYTLSAFGSIVAFYFFVLPLKLGSNRYSTDAHSSVIRSVLQSNSENNNIMATDNHVSAMLINTNDRDNESREAYKIVNDILAVGTAIIHDRRIQLLIPFQISFGLTAGFFGYYINAFIVADYVGDGYIGFFTGIATFSAVILSIPYARIANRARYGPWIIMLFGAVCFTFAGLPLLIASNQQISSWYFLVIYYVIHGAARGAWESTNKAIVTEIFQSEKNRTIAFASIYFTSGLAGAFGFLFNQYMSRTALASVNTILPLIALICIFLLMKKSVTTSA